MCVGVHMYVTGRGTRYDVLISTMYNVLCVSTIGYTILRVQTVSLEYCSMYSCETYNNLCS